APGSGEEDVGTGRRLHVNDWSSFTGCYDPQSFTAVVMIRGSTNSAGAIARRVQRECKVDEGGRPRSQSDARGVDASPAARGWDRLDDVAVGYVRETPRSIS